MKRKLTRRQAWIEVRNAFEAYLMGYANDLNDWGLCNAIRVLSAAGAISNTVEKIMWKDLKKVGGVKSKWSWPLNLRGAKSRVKAIDRILKGLK